MNEEQLNEIEARAAAATAAPWFVSDYEGALQVWREGALRNVTRNEAGDVTGYRKPASWTPGDMVAHWNLDTWDPGADPYDDQLRANARFQAAARTDVPALVAEVRSLTHEVRSVRTDLIEIVAKWEQQRNRADGAESERDRAQDAIERVRKTAETLAKSEGFAVAAIGKQLLTELALDGSEPASEAPKPKPPTEDQLTAAIERAKALHPEFGIYAECGHSHEDGEVGVKEIPVVGLVCTEGHRYSICFRCCTNSTGYQTEDCASGHTHPCYPCPTVAALVLDGSEPADGETER